MVASSVEDNLRYLQSAINASKIHNHFKSSDMSKDKCEQCDAEECIHLFKSNVEACFKRIPLSVSTDSYINAIADVMNESLAKHKIKMKEEADAHKIEAHRLAFRKRMEDSLKRTFPSACDYSAGLRSLNKSISEALPGWGLSKVEPEDKDKDKDKDERTSFVINGDVFGMKDFDKKVADLVAKAAAKDMVKLKEEAKPNLISDMHEAINTVLVKHKCDPIPRDAAKYTLISDKASWGDLKINTERVKVMSKL